MNNFLERVRSRVAQLSESGVAEDVRGCLWSEKIPKFYRGETDSQTSANIAAHLETCTDCNDLLLALAAQSPPAPFLQWIKQGAEYLLNIVVDVLSFARPMSEGAAVTMRGGITLTENRISLPDGRTLYMSIITQAEGRIFSARLEDGNSVRLDVLSQEGDYIKSVDDARQIKLDLPAEPFTLVIDGIYSIRFREGEPDV